MTFVISTLKTIFVLLNTISLLSAAVYLGFGAFMLISKQDALGFGLHELSVALLITGAAIIVLAMIGFCAGSGSRSYAMQFFSGVLLLGAVYQVGFGVLAVIRRSKTADFADKSWNDLSESLRDTFETAHTCCGFKTPNDRTSCNESRLSTAVACSTKLSGRQEELLTWLAISCFAFAILTFINYLVAYSLIKQYTKARRLFKQKETERRRQSSAANEQIKKKYSDKMNEKREEDSLKSAKSSATDYLPDFFKPTPKPVVSKETVAPRSNGSMLTYEEIAAKYRNN